MTEHGDQITSGRAALRASNWSEAYEILSELDRRGALPPEDAELLSTAAFMLGRIDEMLSALEAAHHAYLEGDDLFPAVRTAVWLGTHLASRGKYAQASGWLERAHRLMEHVDEDRLERGYMLLPAVFKHIDAEEYEAAAAVASEAASIGRRFRDDDLVALAMNTQGRALVRHGSVQEGLRLLDEVMVAVTADRLSPMATGLVYCSVIEGCYEIGEIRRAAEWTMALSAWCDAQPDLVAFTDQCLAHRAEIMQLQGTWIEALEQARRAHQRKGGGLIAAQAYYQQAEIHRLRGDFGSAEDDYRNVSRHGGDPQPGLARLRLAQGNPAAAAASLERALTERRDSIQRLAILPAYVDILLSVGDIAAAREASDELAASADVTGVEMHRARSSYARGAVDLSDGRPGEAIPSLRAAFNLWQTLEVPHEMARTRTSLAKALLAVGDEDTARLELEAARSTFSHLGAAPDMLEVEALSGTGGSGKPHDLTPRELEVLRLLASGATNRSIAEKLVLSQRTVDRHVSNIFAKLGVTTRSAATSHAYRHRLM
jgi:DNA-binding CsgD family transcriptional regulator/tetratricopeptide (TPR) repeat protein